MTRQQQTPWATIIGFTSFFALIGWLFGAFDPPKPANAPVAAALQTPVELTPEQKAEQAAKKAENDAENARFARDVAVVRQLKSSMKNPASFDLEDAIRMDDGTLCLSYRTTNSFNAVIFGEAVITKERIYTSDNRTSYVAQYKKLCANKAGKRMRHMRWAL